MIYNNKQIITAGKFYPDSCVFLCFSLFQICKDALHQQAAEDMTLTFQECIQQQQRLQVQEEAEVELCDPLTEMLEDILLPPNEKEQFDEDLEFANADPMPFDTETVCGGGPAASQVQKDPDQEPIYEGSRTTVGAVMLLIAVFAVNHNVTGDGIQQLLSLMALLLPKDNILCTSLHRFRMYFNKLRNPLKIHNYCSYCLTVIPDTNIVHCPNTMCMRTLGKADISYFVQVPIIQQLQNFFLRKGFFNSLQGRFNRSVPKDSIEDIYDGALYKQYFDEGLLNCPQNISFVFNTDGAPVFKSSKVSIWPLYLCINELEYKSRMRKEHMLFQGLWFGCQKPAMWTFLKPFWEEMVQLDKGILCESPDCGSFICRAFLLCGTADLPARCLLCNSIQYNGAHGCWKCQQKGQTAKVGKGHAHVFPFQTQDPKGPPRTPQNVISDAKLALQQQQSGKKNAVVNGIKGPSWLMFFPKFDIVRGIAIDYMHGVLLGVQKLLLKLWFDKCFQSKPFNFYGKVAIVDSRLMDIRPTLDVTRLPRSVSADIKYWKASEYRCFLLFYGPPVLYGVLDDKRFEHYMLLTNSVYLLLQSSISRIDIEKAEMMLQQFCSQFQHLYDVCYMTLNVHQLLHLADGVRDLGPLYTHSCFSFEDKNGFVLKLIRGTQNIDSQLIAGISFTQKLPELRDKCIINGSDEELLYNALDKPHLLKRGEMLSNGIYVLGAMKQKAVNVEEFHSPIDYLGFVPTSSMFRCFNRIEISGDIVYGTNYGRMQKRNQSTIKYNSHGKQFGNVRCFVQYQSDCGKIFNVAFVNKLQCLRFDPEAHIIAVKEEPALEVVPVESIDGNCMLVSYADSAVKYVCEFPNKLESD